MFKIHDLIDWNKMGRTCKDLAKANEMIEAALRVEGKL